MVNIAFVIYRSWAYEILKNILKFQNVRGGFKQDCLITIPQREFRVVNLKKKIKVFITEPTDFNTIDRILTENNINIVCFYGWSWIVPEKLFNKFTCLVLHPSMLPHYRGGSPIQNQILNGETASGVTIFKMTKGIDSGPIYKQTSISLLGDINDIFKRMVDVGTIMTKQLIIDALNNELVFTPQKNIQQHPVYKRRQPNMSEITFLQLEKMPFRELHNYVRALVDPYPNAYIRFGEYKLSLQEVMKYTTLPRNSYLLRSHKLSTTQLKIVKRKSPFLKVKDGYAKIVSFKISKSF